MEPLLDAQALVTGWLIGEEALVRDIVSDADGDHLRELCMMLTGMVAGFVTVIAESKGEDPVQVWRLGISSAYRRLRE